MGHATDPQDGTEPASRLSWSIDIEHCPSACHTHHLQTVTGASGSFAAPDHEYPSSLILTLTATDANGASATTSVKILPRTVVLSFTSAPTGLQLVVGSTTVTTPATRTVIQGSSTTVSASSPQQQGSKLYGFSAWSDGGAQTHAIVAGTANASFQATYVEIPPQADVSVAMSGTPSNDKKKIRFLIDVTNAGPSPAAAVRMTDTLPAGLTFAAATVPGGTCTYDGPSRTVRCDLGTMASAASARVTLDVTVTGQPKEVTNSASVTTTSTDPNHANDTVTVTVRLR
jgi:uncharacterized repeat protein (TIGR01451 family)